jgi:hypothetical protein
MMRYTYLPIGRYVVYLYVQSNLDMKDLGEKIFCRIKKYKTQERVFSPLSMRERENLANS